MADVTFTVKRTEGGSGQASSVQFVARSEVDGVASVAVATEKVTIAAAPAMITAELKSDLKNVNEYRPGDQSLLVTNARDDPVTIVSITVKAPKTSPSPFTAKRRPMTGRSRCS